nr:hypothetical protein [Paracoccus saliphilus]
MRKHRVVQKSSSEPPMNQRAAPPEFAMSFTQEAVQLERREGRSWRPLGQARFAGRDLASVLNALRDEAGGQAGELDTVLVIPDDQILYTTLTVPFGSDTAATVARALEGLTPYRAEELAFDWCPAPNGDIETLRVAAVARRTLEEAEEFARAQGFRPSGFQARPGDDRFDGQPDFGPSRLAQEQFNRRPFSEPDLSQAKVTAPVIEGDGMAAPTAPAVIVSRVTPHVAWSTALPDHPATAPAEVNPDPGATAEIPAGPVIRHGQSGPLTAKRLPPRAEAVHSRAASARAQKRTDASAPTASPTLADRLRHLDPARLPVLVGGLFLVLVLALVFLGGQSDTQAVVDAPAAQPAPAEPSVSAEEPAAEPLTVTEARRMQPAPVQPQATATPDQDAVAETAQAPATATVEEQDALSRALAEALGESPAQPSTTPLPAEAATTVSAEPAPATAIAAAPAPAETAVAAAPVPASAREAATISSALLPARPEPAPDGTPSTATPAANEPASAATPPAPPLARSPRPPRAAPVAAAAPAAPDSRPVVPSNPLPFEAGTAPAPVTASRPPSRPAQRPAAVPAPAARADETPAPAAVRPPSPSRPARPPAEAPAEATPAPAPAVAPALSGRPPQRPQDLSLLEEGSAAETTDPRRLTAAERWLIQRQLRDLRTAQAGSTSLSEAERGLVFQLADARPTRKPVAVRAPSQQAVQSAVAEAVQEQRPEGRSKQTAAAPATPSAAAGMSRSARPASRPGALRATATANSASLSAGAVDAAIASAIEDSAARPGSVPLTALTSSSLPPRRGGSTAAAVAAATGGLAANAMVASATPVAAAIAAAPSSADLRAAAEAQAAQAAQAEQLRQDAELQAQAEARARSQAAADARAEAQARAAAEARARAQAEAEARAAAARNQRYQPPEVDQEPDVVAAVPKTAIGNAAASATVKDGIRLNSTQIIGTIGAGQASRALVRLSNGRVLTLRIGDRINGGTISAIGDSRITYQKGNQAHALGVLNGQ